MNSEELGPEQAGEGEEMKCAGEMGSWRRDDNGGGDKFAAFTEATPLEGASG